MSTFTPRTAEVVIYQGDDLARLTELRQVAETADRIAKQAAKAPLRQGDEVPSAQAEKDAYDAFVNEAAERAVVVEVRAIGRKRFRDLVTDHPPRKVDVTKTDEDGKQQTTQETHEDDEPFGVNVETFPEALLGFVDGDTRTISKPEFPTTAARQAFLDDDLSEGDFENLWISAYYLNRAPSADPKRSVYSNASPKSTET